MSDQAERDFERAADATLHAIDKALADVEDFEVELTMGILTLEFPDGTKYVVNSHRAARQVWMAADRAAWHFDWKGDHWVAAKSGDELIATLESVVARKLGRPFKLSFSPGGEPGGGRPGHGAS
jgi:CyaY protein